MRRTRGKIWQKLLGSHRPYCTFSKGRCREHRLRLVSLLRGFRSCTSSLRLFRGCLSDYPFGKFFGSGGTVPLLIGLFRDLSVDEKLREFAPLSFALEGHRWNCATRFEIGDWVILRCPPTSNADANLRSSAAGFRSAGWCQMSDTRERLSTIVSHVRDLKNGF